MKKLVKERYRVEIEVDGWGDPGRESESIRSQVERHVDVHRRSVSVRYDTRWVCEFCGFDPEETEEEGPVCCQKAIDEWMAGRKNG